MKLAGLTNAWPSPIENRLNMLATGMKTPVGIKLFGPDLDTLTELAWRTAAVLQPDGEGLSRVAGTQSVIVEDNVGSLSLDVDIDREGVARHGLTIGDVQDVVRTAIGGVAVSTAVEGVAELPDRVALRARTP